ncbi:unnamed protein product [Caenorhabditis auriculariae]|uniref:Uncharacterized protein n=1 Tax=Caenorhabditis auriculariae TaxID=2777116 RepID=A0A8S1HKH0_9PELO|nr:unnamed protein product [Caenorhabditis auriculariae]
MVVVNNLKSHFYWKLLYNVMLPERKVDENVFSALPAGSFIESALKFKESLEIGGPGKLESFLESISTSSTYYEHNSAAVALEIVAETFSRMEIDGDERKRINQLLAKFTLDLILRVESDASNQRTFAILSFIPVRIGLTSYRPSASSLKKALSTICAP